MSATGNNFISPQSVKTSRINLPSGAANSTYTTTPTNSVLGYTAGPNGARITRISATPCATVATADQVQMFLDNGTTGASKFFEDSALMATYSMAQNTEAPTTDFGYSDDNPLLLGPLERIYFAQGQSVSINVSIEGADF